MQTHEMRLLYAYILYITLHDWAVELKSLHVATYVLALHHMNNGAN